MLHFVEFFFTQNGLPCKYPCDCCELNAPTHISDNQTWCYKTDHRITDSNIPFFCSFTWAEDNVCYLWLCCYSLSFFFVFAFQLISVFFSMCLSWSSVVDSLRYFINIVILERLFVYFQHSKQQRFNLFNLSLYRIKQNETLLDARNFREKKRREKEEKKERMKEKNVRNAYEMNFSSRHFKWNIFYGLFIFAERYQPKSKHTKQ